jgi:hypothetical protein
MPMEIEITDMLCAGSVQIPPGRYSVRLDEATQTLTLSKAGEEVQLTPLLRSSKMQVRHNTAELRQVGGEPAMLLIVRTPPAQEWVVRLEKAPAV